MRLSFSLLDTVRARVMALILATTVPLAAIAGVLAWHSYLTTKTNSAERVAMAASLVRGELVSDIARTQTALKIFMTTGITHRDVPQVAALLDTLSLGDYCVFVLRSDQHETVGSFDHQEAGGLRCGPDVVSKSVAERWLQAPASGEGRREVSLVSNTHAPLLKITSPVSYVDKDGTRQHGELVAVEALSVDRLRPLTETTSAPQEKSRVEIWLSDEVSRPVPLVSTGPAPAAWSNAALKALRARETGKDLRPSHFMIGSTYYVVSPLIGGISLVARSERSAAEKHALDIFLGRVALIAALLGLELFLVAYAAHATLVVPLVKMAVAVTEWRRTNTFRMDDFRAQPLEIRQLERAFRRAVGRLSRHEERLRRAARHQESLLREIHHRVKNNLQIVASLVNLQANRVREPATREEFRLIRERVRALATLHRYLYPEGGVAELDIAAFLEELTSQIFLSYGHATNGRIRLLMDVEPVTVSPDQAVPLALIVNEAVNNALRHAFGDRREGTITLSLMREEEQCVLTIADDGVGLDAEAVNGDRRAGIGLQLIRGFVRQIQGTLTQVTTQGTQHIIRFAPAVPHAKLAATPRLRPIHRAHE